MSLVFDKHRLIPSPALAPAARRDNADAVLTIGLINNMPDTALQATERQFTQLLRAATTTKTVDLHCFSLPSVKRSQTAQSRIEQLYTDIADLDRLPIDGLIVTGAEPHTASLTEEPYWRELAEIVDWANLNTRSTIWSCLAAHAAVLHLDGIERHRLEEKCSGLFECSGMSDHWLAQDLPQPLRVAHSRLNELKANELTERGYQVLTESPQAGVDIFAKQLQSQFIFFQGHPEYDTLSLQREYQRDISRYLAGERTSYPATPVGYFDLETEHRLASFETRARSERRPALSAELPALALRPDVTSEAAATAIFRNWLGYLGGQTDFAKTVKAGL